MSSGALNLIMNQNRKNVLLVVPNFPIPQKRKIDHNFCPIGLLKIGSYFKHAKGYNVELVFGHKTPNMTPDEIWITSLFTYWSEYVHNCAKYYRSLFPEAKLKVGGIYATLLPERAKEEMGAEIHIGLHKDAEDWCDKHDVDYSILGFDIDFQIMHGMRGCFRRCSFCGVWKIEPEEKFYYSIADKIQKNHIIFYDNNFLRHPDIINILKELAAKRVNGRVVHYESQSGFDGRILTQEIANLLKKARFINPRIAWDNSYDEWPKIEKQIELIKNAGYKSKDIFIFMLYNWDIDYQTMEKKRLKCWEWRVQIADCRYRPLDQMYDYFDSRKQQTNDDYYIHPNWTDEEVKAFRKNVRQHNICVRHSFLFYSKMFERVYANKNNKKILKEYRKFSKKDILNMIPDAWIPGDFHPAPPSQIRLEDFDKYSESINFCKIAQNSKV